MNTDQSAIRKEFCQFLADLSQGDCRIDLWNQQVIRRYADAELEAARRQLSTAAMSIGQCSAIPFPPKLQQLAAEILAELDP